MFVTSWIGIYDSQKKILTYHNAGHTPTYLKREEVISLTTDGMALGVVSFKKVETKSIAIQPNDLLFLYTDGLTERMNMENQNISREKRANKEYIQEYLPGAIFVLKDLIKNGNTNTLKTEMQKAHI